LRPHFSSRTWSRPQTCGDDGPFSSQDGFRRRQNGSRDRQKAGRSAQAIVLSHDPTFLRQVWDRAPATDRVSLTLADHRAQGSKLLPIADRLPLRHLSRPRQPRWVQIDQYPHPAPVFRPCGYPFDIAYGSRENGKGYRPAIKGRVNAVTHRPHRRPGTETRVPTTIWGGHFVRNTASRVIPCSPREVRTVAQEKTSTTQSSVAIRCRHAEEISSSRLPACPAPPRLAIGGHRGRPWGHHPSNASALTNDGYRVDKRQLGHLARRFY